ncbi:oxygen-independent coproporphyrinogen III oxidase [Prosthecochloris sp. N3]|uniref:Coproporphyrinogen-III oxidase n=1 Tax=Prosthecochloris ethylica TaxID=2743976 RepID=A0ABR9XPY1_9CHLB|nr:MULTISPECIES: oxygen-independent coproporphyrinogen III oxidase [Prosthecochloris]MEC9485963.1 oxygen-independent coproporphyrinogen III oxidase [Prosthecochloris sp.]MBF0587160.1 oxygen-independent coproporphyrinogen III oxidase [Prosthecochloris ethylica]MBF0636028.1 oxygen-independent coproporphyrinogen III oxidase [Prosthecochloris ethylica]NUK48342.1 oxygen-independent coproporphyrinogen III oxidase [Prosthecochloris ethylica]RNA64473.1 oxygen-independent coproporphyrinogen III oxidase
MATNLAEKYSNPGPRYTSYPTIPSWSPDGVSQEEWKEAMVKGFNDSNDTTGVSMYIHIPYCENYCYFCGCNAHRTQDHSYEEPYLQALLKEWQMYLDVFPGTLNVKEMHIGGGTPTFFSPDNLIRLVNGLYEHVNKADDYMFSFETNPRSTTREHLEALYSVGFRRMSFGIQDFDPVVQQEINRPQSYELVKEKVDIAREIGFTSVNFDLVYGLPKQTLATITDTIEKVMELRPDRLAFYAYGHNPHMYEGQRRFKEEDLPVGAEKQELYDKGLAMLESIGYHEIGMDHFALEGDALYEAAKNGTLHRNFMGYTENTTQMMLALGASSISDTWYAFAQNERHDQKYIDAVNEGRFPLMRGHRLTDEDLVLRRHILNLMCRQETSWEDPAQYTDELDVAKFRLEDMQNDGIVELSENGVRVTEEGIPFLRNICMAFDARLWRSDSLSKAYNVSRDIQKEYIERARREKAEKENQPG